jgi:hypothetical protein
VTIKLGSKYNIQNLNYIDEQLEQNYISQVVQRFYKTHVAMDNNNGKSKIKLSSSFVFWKHSSITVLFTKLCKACRYIALVSVYSK